MKDKIRLYKYANEKNTNIDILMNFLRHKGFDAKTHMTLLTDEMIYTMDAFLEKAYVQKNKTSNSLNDKSIKDYFRKYNSHSQKKISILENYRVLNLYHMTHQNNLSGIMTFGLLSHDEIRKMNKEIVDISEASVNDRRRKIEPIKHRSVHEYVPLYFNPKNPMLYKRKDLENEIVVLEIDRNILCDLDCVFTNGNAASSSTEFYDDIKMLEKLDWNCLRSASWTEFPDGKRTRCAEVLVYNSIPIDYIKAVNCFSDESLEIARKKCCGYEISVCMNKSIYFN